MERNQQYGSSDFCTDCTVFHRSVGRNIFYGRKCMGNNHGNVEWRVEWDQKYSRRNFYTGQRLLFGNMEQDQDISFGRMEWDQKYTGRNLGQYIWKSEGRLWEDIFFYQGWFPEFEKYDWGYCERSGKCHHFTNWERREWCDFWSKLDLGQGRIKKTVCQVESAEVCKRDRRTERRYDWRCKRSKRKHL